MTRIQLVCTDLDGVLLTSAGGLSPDTRAALAEARAAGLQVMVATGRPTRDALDWALEAGIQGLIACSNGAVMWDTRAGRVLFDHCFTAGQVEQVFAWAGRSVRGAVLGIDTERELVLQPGFADLVPGCWPHDVSADLIGRVTRGNRVVKVLVAHPGLSAPQLADAFGTVTGVRATFSTMHFLEISPERANKGEALRWAAAHRRVPLAATAAVGDMPNDLPMLRKAGLPAAVANAHPEVKAAARILLPSNDDDGVASLIHAILLRRTIG
ncbi:HAD family hydrolase [Nonomuraea sp. NPDC050153]|uniref:HAD family hydrolase n=1 Tax=Nonomuraea sp. NPDC050153 TaxID=3364359 RepID=UPI0037A056F3